MAHDIRITGEMRQAKGNSLVDFLTTAEMRRGDDIIPCDVGFYETSRGNIIPAYVFIKEGITANGNHYESETIEIDFWNDFQ